MGTLGLELGAGLPADDGLVQPEEAEGLSGFDAPGTWVCGCDLEVDEELESGEDVAIVAGAFVRT